MKASEIMQLPIGQQLTLLKKNCNKLREGDIKRSIKFYENDHCIKRDDDRKDYYAEFDELNSDGTTVKRTHKVKKTRLAIPYPQQIVTNACAFTLGNKIDLILAGDRQDEKNIKSFEKFKSLWDNDLKMMTILRQAFRATCIETRCAVNFFYDEESNKIKAKILSLKGGYRVYRHKDDNDKLDAVVVEYPTDEIVDGVLKQGINITEIWTATEMVRYKNLRDPEVTKNRLNKLLFAFIEQDYPEYEMVKEIIEKQDYTRSQHSDVNTRIGNPALVVKGKIGKKPSYNDDVKIYEISAGDEIDASKATNAMMSYLEVSGAPESVKLEMENNEADIWRFTWPDLSNLLKKNFGDLSTKSMRVMLTQGFVKLAEKQEIYDDIIARIISIIKTMAASVYSDPNMEKLDIQFKYNSILPDSDADMVGMLATAVGAGITSREQAVRLLSFNNPETLNEIEKEDLAKTAEVVTENADAANPDGINGE